MGHTKRNHLAIGKSRSLLAGKILKLHQHNQYPSMLLYTRVSQSWPYSIVGPVILCRGDCPVHIRMLISIFGFYPQEASSNLPPTMSPAENAKLLSLGPLLYRNTSDIMKLLESKDCDLLVLPVFCKGSLMVNGFSIHCVPYTMGNTL